MFPLWILGLDEPLELFWVARGNNAMSRSQGQRRKVILEADGLN